MAIDEEFKDKTTEWRGYTFRALEDIKREIMDVKESVKECSRKIDELNMRLTGIQVKVASIGGAAGIITSLVIWLVTRI